MRLMELRAGQRVAILMIAFAIQLFSHILWGNYVLRHPMYQHFISKDWIEWIGIVYYSGLFGAIGLVLIGLKISTNARLEWWLSFTTVWFFTIILMMGAYVSGLLSISTGAVMVGAVVTGMMLLPVPMVLSAVFTTIIAMLVLNDLTIAGALDYAPLFLDISVRESVEFGRFYYFSQFFFATPFLMFFIGIAYLFLKETNSYIQRIQLLNKTDSLTGVMNRRYANDYLHMLLEAADVKSVAIFMIDLDFFKRINDSFGHLTGDQALKMTAQILKKNLRDGDVVARFGGEEFIVILKNIDTTYSMVVAERCREAVSQLVYHSTSHGAISWTCSIGVSVLALPTEMSDQSLIRIADTALYQAKAQGRNCVVLGDSIETDMELMSHEHR
ncbi:diguanylate cyclase (GGDEF)-like protein [Agitococcus lubricus]|uniref:diguanylate cyclase n=2 Tax=Agitococcus lubricus TaxID=1077255 RepID=A0A2T5J3D4_9GAMM|nr:diguanylate cyclase (GGDEF)-like protein [Agitococcus lubricus]